MTESPSKANSWYTQSLGRCRVDGQAVVFQREECLGMEDHQLWKCNTVTCPLLSGEQSPRWVSLIDYMGLKRVLVTTYDHSCRVIGLYLGVWELLFYSRSPPFGLPSTKAAEESLKDCPDLHHCRWNSLKTQFHFPTYRDLFSLSISQPEVFLFLSLWNPMLSQWLQKSIWPSGQQPLNDYGANNNN